MAYRSDQRAVAAALAETQELADVVRQTLRRRTRARLLVGGLLAAIFAAPLVVARYWRSIAHHTPVAGRVVCHQVELRFEQVGGGVAPPPRTWRSCSPWTPGEP